MFRKIGEEKAFDAILNQIIDNIQDGNIKGGDALPAERTMAESMGVSRPTVREAITCSTGKRDCITGSAELYSIG